MKIDFIITSDRTMITNHHGKMFLGFMTTSPPIGLPEFVWNWIACPKIETDKYGRPKQAPYGLRKIEAALQDAGFNAYIIDPDHIIKYVNDAKAIFIGHHDYFAMAAPSCEWHMILGREPTNFKSFKNFMESKAMKIARERGAKIIIGGPGAWQWLYNPEYIKKWNITTIVEGEGEKIIVEIAKRIKNNEELPRYIFVGKDLTPRLDEIPTIKAASVNGLIEIMRGCPRRCKFCPVTLRPIRYYTYDMIEKELKVNRDNGIVEGILHSEDVLLYGARGVEINPDKVIKLHIIAKSYYKVVGWSHTSFASVLYAEEKYRLISKLSEILYDDHQTFLGVEIGLETGSIELAKRIMPGKSKPYRIEDWKNVVKKSFKIMSENNIIPAVTLIAGLPYETDRDVIETIELVKELRPYKSLIVPMFFVPLGYLKDKDWFRLEMVKDYHKELFITCFEHNIYWVKKIVKEDLKGIKYFVLRFLVDVLVEYMKNAIDKMKREMMRA